MDAWSKINLRLLRYREHVRQHYQREQTASWVLQETLDQLIGDHRDGGWPLEGLRGANDNIPERSVTAASPGRAAPGSAPAG
jgi:hypothetical protein